jgi:hypothetical protein
MFKEVGIAVKDLASWRSFDKDFFLKMMLRVLRGRGI